MTRSSRMVDRTANILFAVAFDKRYRKRGVRAAAVHPGGIQTELGRYVDPSAIQNMIEQMNQQLAAEGKAPVEDYSSGSRNLGVGRCGRSR
jgi:NAD(P)-dependent dehydrogenase (short-subunit alcohol dehydrogenase family)